MHLFALCVLLIPAGVQAKDLYVSPAGTPAGPGTMAQPYDLATALAGLAGQPGDTFWLTGGNYVIGHIDTKIQGAPGLPITFRQVPGQRARVEGTLTFFNSAGYVLLRDFEMYSGDTNRVSSEIGAGFNPTDIHPITGIASYSPNMSFINLVVHDETDEGIYLSQIASNNLIYGCVIFNNGWRSPDNAEGHAIYAQGWNANQNIADNILFNNAGVGLHIYDNATNAHLSGITLDGNVAFNAGAIQSVRVYQDMLVGVDAPAINADRIVFENNMGYFPRMPGENDAAQIGRQGINGGVAILNNYLPEGLEINNWTIAAVAGNVVGAQSPNYVIKLNQTLTRLAAACNGNTYLLPATGGGFLLDDAGALGFSAWQSATGYDLNSTYSVGNQSGTKVFIRPNRYEPGRANLIVYNWNKLTNILVDVSSVLAPGESFEVHNAEDFFARPVLTGVFDGQPLNLPMTGLPVAVPNGPMITPPPTGPTFNVFVLLPTALPLQAQVVSGQLRLSWPVNAGGWVLQFTRNLSANSMWTDVTTAPAVVGSYYVVTVPISRKSGFYRLKAFP
ncbi:MAG: right-handed parallel beta-helix repeat-containing protein [Limisphaerales bacterium]